MTLAAVSHFQSLTIGQVVIFSTNAAVLAGLVLKALPVLRKLRDLVDDWGGESARPGVPKRPGVMERLASIEAKTDQLEHNGGASLKDDVTAMRGELGDHVRRSDAERAALWQALGGRRASEEPPPERRRGAS